MADELIDIYDEHNEPTGVQEMKSIAHRDGLWHRSVHVLMYTKTGKILLQLRAKDKEIYPNRWDVSVTGHVSLGEDSSKAASKAAIREAREELGSEIGVGELSFWKTIRVSPPLYKNYRNNEFSDIYLHEIKDDALFQPDSKEVSSTCLISISKLRNNVKKCSDEYVPYGQYWFDVIEEVRKRIS